MDPAPTADRLLVETRHLKLDLPDEGFRLHSGETLPALTVAYEVYGERAADGRNVVYVCHALTGDAHAAGYHGHDAEEKPGWWDPMIGPGKAIDTNRYQVICANILGGCKGTTGPISINPRTGRPYASAFPLITIKDVVRVQKLLLDQLGVPELYAVIGGSLGGMQALEWAVAYPDYVRRCVCIAASVQLTPQAMSFDIIARQEIEHDPHWHGGHYHEHGEIPRDGLSRARQIGHVTYLSPESMIEKFGREQRSGPIRTSKFSTNFQVESYLDYQGAKFVERFDANSYLYISRMMDMYDLVHEYGSLHDAFARTRSQFLIVSISSDWLFPPSQQLDIVHTLLACRKPVSYFQLVSPYGHDAFLIEYDSLSSGVGAFLSGHPDAGRGGNDRRDFDLLADAVPAGAHVLDVGSGDGALMSDLRRRKQATGVCLDIDFEMVVACMRRGLPALQLEADTALDRIQNDAFDTVVLNQTIQQLPSALRALKQLLRIGKTGLVGFPNFGYYSYRLQLLLHGRLPVSKSLPYQWYDTPNIHVVTVKDFRELCARHRIHVDTVHYLSDSAIGRALVGMGLANLGADRVLARITRRQ